MKDFRSILESKLKLYNAVISKEIGEYKTFVIQVSKQNSKKLINDLKIDEEFKFTILTDITAVDYPDRDKRFELVYNLLSIYENIRLLIKIEISDNEKIESIIDIFDAASWYEREVWDMFGIVFDGNNDLRRILTDYEFKGHPLRKDFPLTGYEEVRYDNDQKKVIYEPVQLMQDYRNFDFVSPWEGNLNNLFPEKKGKE